jgi:serine/threonine protein kinase
MSKTNILKPARRTMLDLLSEKNISAFPGEDNHITGKTCEIIFGNKQDIDTAIKTTHIAVPNDYNDTCYRELRILLALKFLNHDRLCPNFIHIIDWFKSKDSPWRIEHKYDISMYTDDAQEPPDDDDEPEFTCVTVLDSITTKPEEENLIKKSKQQYLSIVMERADMNIDEYLTSIDNVIYLTEFKCILFQILFALHVSQRYCGFVHNDLHLGNVMLKSFTIPIKVCCFICLYNCIECCVRL